MLFEKRKLKHNSYEENISFSRWRYVACRLWQ